MTLAVKGPDLHQAPGHYCPLPRVGTPELNSASAKPCGQKQKDNRQREVKWVAEDLGGPRDDKNRDAYIGCGRTRKRDPQQMGTPLEIVPLPYQGTDSDRAANDAHQSQDKPSPPQQFHISATPSTC